MSYNVSNIDIVEGTLYTTIAHVRLFERLMKAEGESLPGSWEWAGLILPNGEIKRLPWHGEGSGHGWEHFRTFLGMTAGTASILIIWEGGDDVTGLVVEDGEVFDGEVVQTVRKAES